MELKIGDPKPEEVVQSFQEIKDNIQARKPTLDLSKTKWNLISNQ